MKNPPKDGLGLTRDGGNHVQGRARQVAGGRHLVGFIGGVHGFVGYFEDVLENAGNWGGGISEG
jgi:hypothetical protein